MIAIVKPKTLFKTYMVLLAFILFSIIVVGLFFFFITPSEAISLPLAYVAGLSMILLPCTLPLAFVIVPLSMRESPRKGLTMALAFGLGLIVTITAYGIVAALIGGLFNLQAANIIFLTIGGIAAYVFGLSELGLVKFTGLVFHAALPGFLRNRGDYAKTFFMGLLLGNMGVGCPNPAFYLLLAYIAASASVLTGASLGLIHAIGRATPLIFLAVLGALGIDTTKKIVSGSRNISKWMGWSLVVLGAILLITGGPFKPWYEESPIHENLNKFLLEISDGKIGEQGQEHMFEVPFIPQFVAPYVFIALIAVPIIAYKLKKKEVTDNA